jgi:tetratricopeptide (TPR) repeat protein
MSAVPEPKALRLVQECERRMNDPTEAITELEVRRFLRDLHKELPDAPPELMGPILGQIGACEARLGNFGRALDAFQNAAYHEPLSAAHESNITAALSSLGRHDEALEHSRKALAKPQLDNSWRLVIHANEVESLSQLGRKSEARATFEATIGYLAPGDATHLLSLAKCAAVVSYDHDAAELFLRYLLAVAGEVRGDESAAEGIQSRIVDARVVLTHLSDLDAAVKRVLDEWEAPTPEEHEIRARLTLDPDGWAKFCELARITPET